MPLFTIKGRRRQITTASTTYAPNVAILVQPRSRNYIPIVPPARGVTRVIKPLVMLVPTGIPGGSPPSRSIHFVGLVPPVGRPAVPRVYKATQTPFVNGTPYGKVSTIRVARVIQPVVRPFKALVPYGVTTPIPPTPAQIRPVIQVVRPIPNRRAYQATVFRVVVNPINDPVPQIRVFRQTPVVPRLNPQPIVKRFSVYQSFPRPELRPHWQPIVTTARPLPCRAAIIQARSAPAGVLVPKQGTSQVIRVNGQPLIVRAIAARTIATGPIPVASKFAPQIIRPVARRPLGMAAQVIVSHSLPFETTGSVSLPRPVQLRVTPQLPFPIRVITGKYGLASPELHDPMSRVQIVTPGKRRKTTPPRPFVKFNPLPAEGLPPDIIAASLLWLRRNPPVVSAFSDSTTALKFGSDYIGQVDYPIARFSDPEEQQYRETVDGQGRIAIVTEGAFVVDVATTAGKTACRQLADLIGDTLTDAPLSWQGAELMYLRQSKRRFPVTTEPGANGAPSLFRRPVEFLYMFESYETP